MDKNIRRRDFHLGGALPSGLGSLTGLALINLSNNTLTGSIPDGLGKLPNLAYLDLSLNQLSGPIGDIAASQSCKILPQKNLCFNGKQQTGLCYANIKDTVGACGADLPVIPIALGGIVAVLLAIVVVLVAKRSRSGASRQAASTATKTKANGGGGDDGVQTASPLVLQEKAQFGLNATNKNPDPQHEKKQQPLPPMRRKDDDTLYLPTPRGAGYAMMTNGVVPSPAEIGGSHRDSDMYLPSTPMPTIRPTRLAPAPIGSRPGGGGGGRGGPEGSMAVASTTPRRGAPDRVRF
ncbi:hypothetical protein BC828DRAFT_394455 [Blastocladiella britannica]|nr:hypothetical protein BC828DRAFT_394455 [Blastocladiella britannica]